MVFIYMFILNVGLFFLSIPIPVFIPSDRFAWNGPVRLSFTDRQKRPGLQTRTPKTGKQQNNSTFMSINMYITAKN